MNPKFRYCTQCQRRTPHQQHAAGLRCSVCLPIAPSETRVARDQSDDGGLMAALRLCGKYPHAFNCFLIHNLKIVIKVLLFIVVFAKVLDRGFWVSTAVVAIGFFAIDCFGPRGREKTVAKEFGKQLWTTILKGKSGL